MNNLRTFLPVVLLLILFTPRIAAAGPYDHLIGPLIIFFLVAAAVFLIIRELMCWYWKINIMVGLLEDIKNKLGTIGDNISASGSSMANILSTSPEVGSNEIICPKCGEKTSAEGKFCEVCGARLA